MVSKGWKPRTACRIYEERFGTQPGSWQKEVLPTSPGTEVQAWIRRQNAKYARAKKRGRLGGNVRYKLHTPESVVKGIEQGAYEVRLMIDGLEGVFVIATPQGYAPVAPEHSSLITESRPKNISMTFQGKPIARVDPEQKTVLLSDPTPVKPDEVKPVKLKEITDQSVVWAPPEDDFAEELRQLGLE